MTSKLPPIMLYRGWTITYRVARMVPWEASKHGEQPISASLLTLLISLVNAIEDAPQNGGQS